MAGAQSESQSWLIRVAIGIGVTAVVAWGSYTLTRVEANACELRALDKSHLATLARHDTEIEVMRTKMDFIADAVREIRDFIRTLDRQPVAAIPHKDECQ